MDFNHTDKVLDLMDQLNAFMNEHVYPNEETYTEHFKSTDNKWVSPPLMQELKNKAKDAGLWNLFLPESEHHLDHMFSRFLCVAYFHTVLLVESVHYPNNKLFFHGRVHCDNV